MKFHSTRGKSPSLGFSEALQSGLASDGGLYVPDHFPKFSAADLPEGSTLATAANRIIAPFLAEDPLLAKLPEICDRALNFPTPVTEVDSHTSVLELFHGPTAAFKDVGARFLAECILASGAQPTQPRTVMVATSGDTGGAVAAAFFGKPGIDVAILFPKGRISPRQEKQLTAWGGNVRAFSVRGDFDACQRLVKESFLDPEWKQKRTLISANSINIGRIFPQTVYYALAASTYFRQRGVAPGFVIPTGNLGNALAALWAQKMGFPIRAVVLAFNANRAVLNFLKTEHWRPEPTVATLANAMDVGNPSNMERLLDLFPNVANLKKGVQAFSANDSDIREAIQSSEKSNGRIWCPHTAAAVYARKQLRDDHWIIVSTAHSAKFETVVEPLIGRKIEIPLSLQSLLAQPSRALEIDPDLQSLKQGFFDQI